MFRAGIARRQAARGSGAGFAEAAGRNGKQEPKVQEADYIERARALAPFIAERALSAEKERKPDDEVIRRLDEAGIFTILVPKRWGGPELGLNAQLEIVEVISSACMSTGWITAFYIGHHLFACRMSERAQEEMFANGPRCLLPATSASLMDLRKVPGGWIVNGKGTWGSGIVHGDWAMIAGLTEEGLRSCVIPVSDLTYDDVWHMAGMAATGSNDIVAKDVFVPDHRTELHAKVMSGEAPGCSLHTNPMYSMALMSFIYAEIIGVFSGGLIGAQASFADFMKNRGIVRTPNGTVERANNHIHLGRSAANVIAVKELARNIVRISNEMIAAREYPLSQRLELKALTGVAVDLCCQAVNEMVNKGGAFNFREDAPLQRFFRDINMVATHAFWSSEIGYEQLGRDLTGLAPNNPLV